VVLGPAGGGRLFGKGSNRVGERPLILFDPEIIMMITSCAPHVIDMPGWRPIARHALRTMFVVSLLPMAIFYTTMALFGIRAAVLTTVAWFYAGLLLKALQGKPLLGARVLGAALLSIRAVVMFVSGSAFLYFLQPVAGTVAVAAVFATTAAAGRPVLDRLAHEFCPFPEELSERLRGTRFFSQLSIVWSMTYLMNAAGTVWLLTNASLSGFVLIKSVASPVFTISAVAASYLMFRMTIQRQGILIRWNHEVATA
jgi:uncharacterized membrane protein